jgi:hypothetical protein
LIARKEVTFSLVVGFLATHATAHATTALLYVTKVAPLNRIIGIITLFTNAFGTGKSCSAWIVCFI